MFWFNKETRKYIGENVSTFLIAGAIIVGPLVGGYIHLASEIRSLNADRIAFERERATSQVEIAREKLEIEKIRVQLTVSTENSRQMLQEVSTRQQQTASERAQLNESWKNIEAWRQKLNPEAEFKSLIEQFTALGVNLDNCAKQDELEKYERARLIAQRIFYTAIQTNNPINLQFAKRIQPMSSGVFQCPVFSKTP